MNDPDYATFLRRAAEAQNTTTPPRERRYWPDVLIQCVFMAGAVGLYLAVVVLLVVAAAGR